MKADKASKTKKTEKKRYVIPNLRKAFDLLELIAGSPEGITFPKMLEKVSCNKTSLFRILMTLEEIGYLRKNPESDAYVMSRKILKIAYGSLCDANLIGESIDIMRQVRDLSSETTMLGVLLDDECIMLEQEQGLHPFNFIGKLGMKSHLHASAPGKALLAALPVQERKQILSRIKLTKNTSKTISSLPVLEKEFSEIAKRGYASDESEAVDGVNCVASAIVNAHGYPVAVLWITGPSNRVSNSEFKNFGAILQKATKTISERIGYTK